MTTQRWVPRLHLISEPSVCSWERLTVLLPALLEAGVEAIHVRSRQAPASELLTVACTFRRLVAPPRILVVNDRVDLAVLSEADGVHLPEHGLRVAMVRRLLGGGRLVGRSVHSVEAAQEAVREGCDYLLFGNVFETDSKPGAPGRGLAELRAVAGAVSVPVIAVGGITPARVAEVLVAGAYGVAVIRGVLGADDPVGAVVAYRQELDEVVRHGDPRRVERETRRTRWSADAG